MSAKPKPTSKSYEKITHASHGRTFEAYEIVTKGKKFFCDAVDHNNAEKGCPNPGCFRHRGER